MEPLKEGRTIIRNVIYHCGICRKNHGSPFKMPKMSPWQAKKLSESVPFTYTRLDYLHSFYTKRNPSKNILICLFICVAVMAVHLEVVDDNFSWHTWCISRRCTPKEIILDNAPQFQLTKTAIEKAWQSIVTDEDVRSYTGNQNIKWRFIVEFAPWMGDFYESLVGMVKSSLRKATGRTYLTKTQFINFTTELEGIINLGPFVYIDDINTTNAMVPMHFFSLNPKIAKL